MSIEVDDLESAFGQASAVGAEIWSAPSTLDLPGFGDRLGVRSCASPEAAR